MDDTISSSAFSSGHESLFFDLSKRSNEEPFTQRFFEDDKSDGDDTESQIDAETGDSTSDLLKQSNDAPKDIHKSIENIEPGNSSDTNDAKRKKVKKAWVALDYEQEVSEEDWEKIFDSEKKAFIKSTYSDFFLSKLETVTPCTMICCNKYAGRNTWTIELRCNKCKREFKLSSKIVRKFQLLSTSVDSKCTTL